MKFINKIFLVGFLQVFTAPSFTGGSPGIAHLVVAFGLAVSTLFFAGFWEFSEQMSDLTAFNEIVEEKTKEKAMDLLDWSSLKLYGEKIGSST